VQYYFALFPAAATDGRACAGHLGDGRLEVALEGFQKVLNMQSGEGGQGRSVFSLLHFLFSLSLMSVHFCFCEGAAFESSCVPDVHVCLQCIYVSSCVWYGCHSFFLLLVN
jgi:hypothetical protein